MPPSFCPLSGHLDPCYGLLIFIIPFFLLCVLSIPLLPLCSSWNVVFYRLKSCALWIENRVLREGKRPRGKRHASTPRLKPAVKNAGRAAGGTGVCGLWEGKADIWRRFSLDTKGEIAGSGKRWGMEFSLSVAWWRVRVKEYVGKACGAGRPAWGCWTY